MADRLSALVDSDGRLASGSSDAIVPWWSFTKTLIAVSALKLVEQGRLPLDAPMGDRPYSLRQILQHRAGVANYGGLAAYHEAVARGENPWPDDVLLDRIGADRLIFRPDEGWAYSNVGYLFLRRALESLCQASIGAILREQIFQPLGLEGVRFAACRDDMLATAFAGGHFYHPGWVYHGLVIGPVSEAALALHRIMTGTLLGAASKRAMLDRYPIGGAVPGRPWLTHGYGLGLMIGDMQGPNLDLPVPVQGHSAVGPGSSGAVYHAPDLGRTAAVFTAEASEAVAEFEALRLLAG